MICPICHQQTTPTRIGTGIYCQVCHSRLSLPGSSELAPKHMTDLRPAGAQPQQIDGRPAQTAAALHAKTAMPGARTLDLRNTITADPFKEANPGFLTSANANPDQPTRPDHEPEPIIQSHHAETPALSSGNAVANNTHVTAHQIDQLETRLARAQGISRSRFVAKFDHQIRETLNERGANGYGMQNDSTLRLRAEQQHHAPMTPAPRLAGLTAATMSSHAAMAKLPAPSPGRINPLGPSTRLGNAGTLAAIMAIMGGYIWFQNYPKMAIQSAANQAGVAASLPGYVPSSFTLADTHARPGLVTLSFKSPNQDTLLTIKQQATSSDSHSLLDNLTAKGDENYNALEGQGLTIYVKDAQTASWINHGILYTISGITHLSGSQILKIAYSL